ncbi:MAG: ferritin family protein [bacterium]|nr:ferritin family protein [bacterium]
MPKDKKTLISEFDQMRELEEWAGGFYMNITSDSRIQEKEIKETFREISNDEARHVKIVEKIISIINNNL